jgi:hypothetical protein
MLNVGVVGRWEVCLDSVYSCVVYYVWWWIVGLLATRIPPSNARGASIGHNVTHCNKYPANQALHCTSDRCNSVPYF